MPPKKAAPFAWAKGKPLSTESRYVMYGMHLAGAATARIAANFDTTAAAVAAAVAGFVDGVLVPPPPPPLINVALSEAELAARRTGVPTLATVVRRLELEYDGDGDGAQQPAVATRPRATVAASTQGRSLPLQMKLAPDDRPPPRATAAAKTRKRQR
jgi:hypothetical protein